MYELVVQSLDKNEGRDGFSWLDGAVYVVG